MSAAPIPPGSGARGLSAAPGAAGTAGVPPRDDRAELRKLAHELEGLFVNQLFQAMRASVSSTGLSGQSDPGQELFTSMLDQSMAQEAARHMNRGIADALYRQLVRRLDEGQEPTR